MKTVVRSNEHHFPGNLLWLTQPFRTMKQEPKQYFFLWKHSIPPKVSWGDRTNLVGTSVDEFMGEKPRSCCVGIPTSPRWIGDGQFFNPLWQWEKGSNGVKRTWKMPLECKGSAQIHLKPSLEPYALGPLDSHSRKTGSSRWSCWRFKRLKGFTLTSRGSYVARLDGWFSLGN